MGENILSPDAGPKMGDVLLTGDGNAPGVNTNSNHTGFRSSEVSMEVQAQN